jgi:hypothetical protein
MLCVVMSLLGCATDSTRFGLESDDHYDANQGDSAAFGAVDGFTFRKTQNIRPMNDFHFYFKHCSMSDDRSYYSKTAYWCTDP